MVLTWMLAAAVLPALISAQADPCVGYYDLGSAQRSAVHTLTEYQTPICDEYTINDDKWARFKQYNGEKIPEYCPELMKCGTQGPIWLNGLHPSDYTEKTVQVCLNLGQTCCDRKWDIKVKRCRDHVENEDFYVYKLKTPGTGCSVAYCAGDKAPCPRYSIWNSTLTTCVCYRDDICPIDPNVIPILEEKMAVEQHPGQYLKTIIEGQKIYNGNLVCEITYAEILRQKVAKILPFLLITPGTYVSYYAAYCTLPPLPTDGAAFHTSGDSTNGWRIRLSNNGGLNFSEAIVFPAVNSACHTCDKSGCELKANVCFVQGQCHQAGARDLLHPCLKCDPEVTTGGWVATSGSCMSTCETGKKCTFSQEEYDTVTPPTTTSTTTRVSSVASRSITTSTPPTSVASSLPTISGNPGSWKPWTHWSNCSKEQCDYGVTERTRQCAVPTCSGVNTERQLCNAFNCKESDVHFEQGVILLIQIDVPLNETLLKLVVSESSILEIFIININAICVGSSARCCQTDSGNILGGSAQFVSWDDAFVASGYPRVYSDISVVGLKILILVNSQADQLICGRTRDLKQGFKTTYIPKDVLKEAINMTVTQIENKTGLTIKAYLLPGDHSRSTPPPTGTPSALSVSMIVAIAISAAIAVVAVVAIIIFVLAKKVFVKKIDDSRTNIYAVPSNFGDHSGDVGLFHEPAQGNVNTRNAPYYAAGHYYEVLTKPETVERKSGRHSSYYDTIPAESYEKNPNDNASLDDVKDPHDYAEAEELAR